MKVSRGKIPPGGWHFELAPGHVINAINEEKLVAMIFEYRARNNLPVGDIEREIDDYYCKRWPEACQKEPSDYSPVGPSGERREPMLNRVTRWASQLAMRMPRGGFQIELKNEAERRAGVCFACPKNVPWKSGCAGCSQTTTTLLMQLRNLQITEKAGNLMGCEVCGWDNMTAVHLDPALTPLSEAQENALPERCWRRS